MSPPLERVIGLSFPLLVTLVVAHVLGVPYARSAALLVILVAAGALGLERLLGDRTTLDVAAGVLLPLGALVGAAVGVFGVGVSGSGDASLAFLPLAPGIVALYATRRELPTFALSFGLGSK